MVSSREDAPGVPVAAAARAGAGLCLTGVDSAFGDPENRELPARSGFLKGDVQRDHANGFRADLASSASDFWGV